MDFGDRKEETPDPEKRSGDGTGEAEPGAADEPATDADGERVSDEPVANPDRPALGQIDADRRAHGG
jgi:hypothetical protein